MRENDISNLLEKYDDGLTSHEEEERIDKFMNHHPEHLRASWFISKRELLAQKSKLTLADFHATRSPKISWYKSTIFRVAATLLLACVATLAVVLNENSRIITIASGDTTKQISLPDGSVLTLNQNTAVRYSPDFDRARNVWLDTGEAFFEVAKNPDNPFIVHTPETQTRVTGTSFNVRRNAHQTEVTVLSGQVIFMPSETESDSLVLTKGMVGEYHENAKALKEGDDFDINKLAWKTHRLAFSDVPLRSVKETLEQYFKIHIDARDTTILKCRFRGVFEEANLNEIAEVMKYSLGVNLTLEGSVYNLSGHGCKP